MVVEFRGLDLFGISATGSIVFVDSLEARGRRNGTTADYSIHARAGSGWDHSGWNGRFGCSVDRRHRSEHEWDGCEKYAESAITCRTASCWKVERSPHPRDFFDGHFWSIGELRGEPHSD